MATPALVATPLLDLCFAGLAGAASVEVAELYGATRRVKEFPWRLPGEARFSVYLFSVVLRLALGVFGAWLCARTGPLNIAGAAAAGIAAPKLIEQLDRSRNPATATRRPRTQRAAAKVGAEKASPSGVPAAAMQLSTAVTSEVGAGDGPAI